MLFGRTVQIGGKVPIKGRRIAPWLCWGNFRLSHIFWYVLNENAGTLNKKKYSLGLLSRMNFGCSFEELEQSAGLIPFFTLGEQFDKIFVLIDRICHFPNDFLSLLSILKISLVLTCIADCYFCNIFSGHFQPTDQIEWNFEGILLMFQLYI